MNAWAADFDENHFKGAKEFSVERYLENPEGSGTPHYAYGAGSRMCAGSHLANRELYAAFVRLIVAFHIDPPKNKKDEPILDCLECNAVPTSLTTDPKPFKVGFRTRDPDQLNRWILESEEKTADLMG
jgi:phenylacetate 2-hydroxylase